MEAIIGLAISLVLLLIAMFAGRAIAKRHRLSLESRERDFADFHISDLKSMPNAVASGLPPLLLTGEVTLGADYFISFLAGLRYLIGGNIGVYEKLMLRARREVILRMIEEAHAQGYNAIANLRLEFSDISGNAMRRKGAFMVTVMAYGTAYRAAPSAPART